MTCMIEFYKPIWGGGKHGVELRGKEYIQGLMSKGFLFFSLQFLFFSLQQKVGIFLCL